MSSQAILDQLRPRGIRLELEPARRLVERLGGPLTAPAVLVAGTNGKGSTAAFLEAMARDAGYRTGLFTSPCLERVTEQVRIAGAEIGDEELALLLGEAVRTGERLGLRPTAFEVLTAAALRAFARTGVELAVLEAGMGGARDATNVTSPAVSVVTTVGRDHEAFLGEDLAAVARDKSGIFRRGAPAIWGWIAPPEAERELVRRARETGALARPARSEVRYLRRRDGGLALATGRHRYHLEPALPGAHQAANLALAVLAAEALAERGFPRLDAGAIARGAAACRWPARLEWLDAGRRVLLDAAHNPLGAAALAAYLDERQEPFDLLFGVLGDKDAAAMLRVLGPRARRLVLTAPRDPRAWEPRWDGGDATVEPDLVAALDAVLVDEAVPLAVTGSVHLVGDVRRLIIDR